MEQFRKNLPSYLLGIIILTLGISLTIHSALGTSPFDALLVGLHHTFGLTIGSWEIVVGFTLILINAIISRSKPEFFAMITSFVTGLGIDSWLFIQGSWLTPDNMLEQFSLLIAGIICTGIGVAIYLESSFAPNPMDRSMVILTEKTGLSFSKSRIIVSTVLVIAALFFNGAIGIGTLLNALVTGFIIQAVSPYIKRFLQKSPIQKQEAH